MGHVPKYSFFSSDGSFIKLYVKRIKVIFYPFVISNNTHSTAAQWDKKYFVNFVHRNVFYGFTWNFCLFVQCRIWILSNKSITNYNPFIGCQAFAIYNSCYLWHLLTIFVIYYIYLVTIAFGIYGPGYLLWHV